MLVLQRKCGEEIHIAGRIVVRVLGVSGGRVRLGIEAPKTISVLRGEVVLAQSQALAESAECDLPSRASVCC